MSLLNDVLRDLDKRNASHSDGPPDGVPPGLLSDAGRQQRSGSGFGRGQLMRLVVWVLILLSLITALIVGWRTLDLGQQALDRIPVDENLHAVPRNSALDGEVKPVKPLPARITAQDSALSADEVTQPVSSSQYPPPETAALSGPSPGEPDSRLNAAERPASTRSTSSAITDAPAPTVTVVGETEVIVASPPIERRVAAEPERESDSAAIEVPVRTAAPQPKSEAAPKPEVRPEAAARPKPQAASQPQPAPRPAREDRSDATADMKVATLAARRLDEARALQAAGQTQAALDLFDRLEPSIASPGRAPALFSFKAGILQQQGRYAEAASLYATLLQMKTADAAMSALEARWWSGLAIALEQLRQAERAHAAWLNALSAGGLPTTMRSYAAGRIAALSKAGIKPDYQTVLDSTSAENNSKQDQR